MYTFLFFLLFLPFCLPAQVFMRPFDHAGALGMGGAAGAYPEAGYTNPAAPAFGPATYVSASSVMPYGLADWQSGRAQAVFRAGRNGGCAAEVLHAGIDAYREQRMRLVYARKLAANWSLGVAGDLLHVAAPEYGSGTSATFGIGMLARVHPEIWLASQVVNPLQQRLAGIPLPTVLILSGAWRPGGAFVFTADVEKALERQAEVRCGLEYRPLKNAALRLGVRTHPSRVSAGAGLVFWKQWRVDAAAEWHPVLGVTPGLAMIWTKKQS
jgi:hypothetical protein